MKPKLEIIQTKSLPTLLRKDLPDGTALDMLQTDKLEPSAKICLVVLYGGLSNNVLRWFALRCAKAVVHNTPSAKHVELLGLAEDYLSSKGDSASISSWKSTTLWHSIVEALIIGRGYARDDAGKSIETAAWVIAQCTTISMKYSAYSAATEAGLAWDRVDEGRQDQIKILTELINEFYEV